MVLWASRGRGMFGFFKRRMGLTSSELARAIHSEWLTRALEGRKVYPRIPTRRVDEGGFDALRARARGMARAEQWWTAALERVDEV